MTLLKISIAALLALSVAIASAIGASKIVPPSHAVSSLQGAPAIDDPSCPLDLNPFNDAAPVRYALCGNHTRELRTTP